MSARVKFVSVRSVVCWAAVSWAAVARPPVTSADSTMSAARTFAPIPVPGGRIPKDMGATPEEAIDLCIWSRFSSGPIRAGQIGLSIYPIA